MLQPRHRSDRQLRGDDENSAVVHLLEYRRGAIEYELHIGDIIFVYRCVVCDPNGIACSGRTWVRREVEVAAHQTFAQQIWQARLRYREAGPAFECLNQFGVVIDRSHGVAGRGETCRRNGSEMPKTNDSDLHR